MNYFLIFLTGLTSGGLTCLAVQGGLLATLISKGNNKTQQVIIFLSSRILAYSILGFFLGYFGSIFQLSITLKAIFACLAGFFMIFSALSLLNIHPIFRRFVIQPPKFFFKLLRKEAKEGSDDIFASMLLGIMTILIPCGTTQAMEVLAITSGNPLSGLLIMAAFLLGTTPTFFILGFAHTKLTGIFGDKFLKATAMAVLVMGVLSLNGGLNLAGSSITLETFRDQVSDVFLVKSPPSVLGVNTNDSGRQELNIAVSSSGYSPNNFTIPKSSQVRINLITNGKSGCASTFVLPSLGIQKSLPDFGTTPIDFTAPEQPTVITFTCGMGMYRGIINVI